MAPQKRARREEDEVLAVESARSNLRHDAQRKKARISINATSSKSRNARETSTVSSSALSSDAEAPHDDPEEASIPQSTQYEILRDGGFEHLKNPDLDDQHATQRFLARNQQIGDNHAADNAIIEEITCINFMCHDKLHVELGPLINFIVGLNGSGKSAVLTAITLCLGGKASATNRGASLKSLIKEDRDQAALIIRLKNQGPDAYQPDLYGESIVVERHFSRGGSTGYKLKNALGRLVSAKKGDVDDIVEYFQLQVDNPMNVLTQDAAKSFITASTPPQKYDFFVKGVQLEQLDNDYRLVSDTCDQIDVKLVESKQNIKTLEKKADEAKERAKIVLQHENMRQAARKYSNQAAWAQVEEQEKNLMEREKKVTEANDRIRRAAELVEEKDLEYQRYHEALGHATESAEQLSNELIPLKDEADEAKRAHDDAGTEVKSAHTLQRQVKDALNDANKKVQGIQSDIDTEIKRMEAANGGSRARMLDEIELSQRKSAELKATLEQSEAEPPRLEEELQIKQDEANRAKGPIAAKKKEISDCKERLNNLRSNRVDIMAGFDRNMPQLLQRISRDDGFEQKPVGPVGLHIKLLKPMWSDILETTMGRILSGFIVTSKADQVRLSNMMRQLGIEHCPIVIGNNQPLDTTGHEPDPQYETILRVLKFDNDLVRRQLIINQSIEQSILVRSRSEAVSIMFDGARPKNVRQCFAPHDFRRDCSHRLAFTGRNGSNHEMTPIRAPTWKPRMNTDNDQQINFQKETLDQLERELKALENTLRQMEHEVQKCERMIDQHKRAHQALKIKAQRADDDVERLQAEYDRDNVEDGRLEALKVHLEEAQRDVEMYRDSYGNAALEKDKLNEISISHKRVLDAVKERLADHEAKVKKALQKARNIGQARQIALQEKNRCIAAMEDLNNEMATAERKRDQQAAHVASFIEQAGQVCPRVPVDEGETTASIDAKLAKLSERLKSYQKRLGGTDEEIMDAATEANRIYETAKSHRKQLQELLALLKLSFLKRVLQFKRFQRFISARSRINFNYLLSERAFRGKLLIDHESRRLDVHVEPDETTRSGKGRQTKTLSGGEKSFSSICLLLSLWEAMGAPLRCLDEFDVFMDDVNRDVSTRMIISAARRSVGRQFILITPKALGAGVADAEDVKIIKLVDPRDKQRRIDEMLEDA